MIIKDIGINNLLLKMFMGLYLIIYFEFVGAIAVDVSDVCEKLCTYNKVIVDIFVKKSLRKPTLQMKGRVIHSYIYN